MRKHKIISGVIVLIVLAFVFWYGGDSPSLRGWTAKPEEVVSTVQSDEAIKEEITQDEKPIINIPKEENKPQKADETPTSSPEKEALEEESTSENNIFRVQNGKAGTMETNETTGSDKYFTEPVPEDKPQPIEPQNVVVTDKEYTCTLSVRCDTILNNIEWLDKEKIDIVPKDGVIFAERTVTFYEGESVFNLLLREMKRNKIHLEFVNIPIYNSAYIEGIANIYEFDCGELSGWMYKVNDWFPNYGCSRYRLKAGDRVEWVYSCNLGNDVNWYLGE